MQSSIGALRQPVDKQGRVVMAMSGGVDSSVAAALLVESGHDVIGVMMKLWAEVENSCCSPEAIDDARQVADQLGIPFHLVSYEAEFKECVVDYFLGEYARARTPNPCLACNQQIRFGTLLNHARELGAVWLATGHYASVDWFNGAYRLCQGIDPQKDQSYVLYMLGQDRLRQILFPLGQYTKMQVRDMARQRGLPVADKGESMDLCFVAGDDYRRFLRERIPEATTPGPILDGAGKQLGAHSGLPFYTVGQRKGLGIAAREPLYVQRLDLAHNALIVGPVCELGRTELIAEDVRYVMGKPPATEQKVRAKIRYRATLAEATWTPLEARKARVEFTAPMRDITPGQAVVAYTGESVLGGGIIGG
jgi:tRNA-specific 2-thiouridylase